MRYLLSSLPFRLALSSSALTSAWGPSCHQHLIASSSSGKIRFASYFSKTTTRLFSARLQSDDGEDLTLESLAEKLANDEVKNVVVLIGAGASVSAGIPDFRSPGTGLYDRLQRYNLPFPEAIFDLSYYKEQPKPFVELCEEIWPGKTGKFHDDTVDLLGLWFFFLISCPSCRWPKADACPCLLQSIRREGNPETHLYTKY